MRPFPQAAQSSWLRSLVPRNTVARARLVCFPHAGGTAGAFRELAELLAPEIEVLAIQYPGRQDRFADPFITDFEELADLLAELLTPGLGRPPTAFLGHSMGATVAYEVARRLRPRYPSPLSTLFVSARKAPDRITPMGLDFDDEEIRLVVDRLGGTGSELLRHPDLWELAAPILRNDFLMSERYHFTPGPPVACPLTVLVGDADDAFTAQDAAHWSRHTLGPFAVHSFEGGHFYFEHDPEPLARVLAQALRQWTDQGSTP
ncbi:thioesterase II family protein [Streptomyces sp. NPDC004059]